MNGHQEVPEPPVCGFFRFARLIMSRFTFSVAPGAASTASVVCRSICQPPPGMQACGE